jgi:transcriptional regulator with XRE-family HTH domain
MSQTLPFFNQNLKRFRQDKGFSQKQLANHLRIGLGNIARYERGEVIPKLDVVIKIAALLEVSIDVLCSKKVIAPSEVEKLAKKAGKLPEEKLKALEIVLKQFVES